MKRTKEDKMFFIEHDRANRDHLSDMAMFSMAYLISLSALIVSLISFLLNVGVNYYTLIAICILVLLLIFILAKFSMKPSVMIRNSMKLNKQLDKELTELYPEYKNKLR